MKTLNVLLALVLLITTLSAPVGQAAALEDMKWEEISSRNFVVYSSVDRNKAVEFLKYMELFYALVPELTTIDTTQRPVPTQIVFVRKKSDLRQLGIPAQYGGQYLEGLRNNLIVVRESKFDYAYEAIYYHYIKHLLNSSSSTPIPTWISEGFAQYLRTVVLEGYGSRIKVGRLSKYTRRGSSACGWKSAVELLDDEVLYGCESGIRASRFVRQLLQNPNMKTQLNGYLQRLSNGENRLEAFATAFDVDLAKFNAEVLEYSEKTLLPTHTMHVEALIYGFKTTSRKMSREEAALVLGRVALKTRQLVNAKYWLAIAASTAENRPRALSAMGVVSVFERRLDEAEDFFSEANELDSGNTSILLDTARLWFRRAYDEASVKERDQHLVQARHYVGKAWKLNDKDPETYAMYGRSFLLQQNYEKAIDTLEASNRLLPSHSGVLLDLGQAYQRLNRQDDGVELFNTLVRRSHLITSERKYVHAINWKKVDDSRLVRKRDEIEFSRKRVQVRDVETFWY